MFKSLVAFALLAIVGGHELDRLDGRWYYRRIYPKTAASASASSKITADGESSVSFLPLVGTFECVCDGAATSFPAVDSIVQTKNYSSHVTNYPTIIARSTDRPEDLTEAQCQCSVFKNATIHPIVFRFVNENDAYVVEYDRHYNSVSLLSKSRYSNEEETRKVLESDAELKRLEEELGERRLSFGNIPI